MRTVAALFLCAISFVGCQKSDYSQHARDAIRIENIAITVLDHPRSYMQSDKEGGFLVGTIARGSMDRDRWSVNGTVILDGLDIEIDGKALMPDRLDSGIIRPFEVRRSYAGGTTVTLASLDAVGDVHAMALVVDGGSDGPVSVRPIIGGGLVFGGDGGGRGRAIWKTSEGRTVVLTGGPSAKGEKNVVMLHGRPARFLVVDLPKGRDPATAEMLLAALDTAAAMRRGRMERFLNASYLRTSDDTLTMAIQWIKLSLDGLVVEGRDTFAVGNVPWDGSIDARGNAQSIAGIGLATGDYGRTGAIIRTLARYQDTRAGSRTFGRIPDRIIGGKSTYGGADVSPWFVRELYEHVVYANDTSLVRSLFPVIERSLEGTYASHTDKENFLTHGPYETWMTQKARGNRAVEMQLLWYFQQMISSYVAAFLGDTTHEEAWWTASAATADNFAKKFSDTVSHTLVDHLEPGGKRSAEVRPNGVMCLEILEQESMRFGVVRQAARTLMSPMGVATLSPAAADGATLFDGKVWSWLAGPVTYALTRYDRQDLSYRMARSMARCVLNEGMAGTLPEILPPGSGGSDASLTGMAEFMRSIYQDYLGLRVDFTTKTLTIQPKLPDDMTEAEFTVYAGSHPIDGTLRRTHGEGRIILRAQDLPEPMKVSFLWILENGDAWRGAVSLAAGKDLTLIFTDDAAMMFLDAKEAKMTGARHLKKFSQRESSSDLGQ